MATTDPPWSGGDSSSGDTLGANPWHQAALWIQAVARIQSDSESERSTLALGSQEAGPPDYWYEPQTPSEPAPITPSEASQAGSTVTKPKAKPHAKGKAQTKRKAKATMNKKVEKKPARST